MVGSIAVALATSSCTEPGDSTSNNLAPDATTTAPAASSSDGGLVKLGDSAFTVVRSSSADSGSGESATVSLAVFYENTSEADVAAGAIEMEWLDADGSPLNEYESDLEARGRLEIGTVLPGETGAVAHMVLLAKEPADVRLSIHDVIWEPYSEDRHGQCEISDLVIHSSTYETEFSFTIESTYPDTLGWMSPTIVLFDGEDFIGGVAPMNVSQYIRDVGPGTHDGSLIIDTFWLPDDIDQLDTEVYCIEPETHQRNLELSSSFWGGRPGCGSGGLVRWWGGCAVDSG